MAAERSSEYLTADTPSVLAKSSVTMTIGQRPSSARISPQRELPLAMELSRPPSTGRIELVI